MNKCREREDTWSEEVCRRISLSIDLVVSNAICQEKCKSVFLTKKHDPGHGQSGETPRHPSNKPMVESLKTLCNWLGGQNELYTTVELQKKLCTVTENDYVFSIKWLKKKVKERYGDSLLKECCGDSLLKERYGDSLLKKRYGDSLLKELYGDSIFLAETHQK